MNSFVLTPAMGKRLIGKALAAHPAVRDALTNGTLVIIAGTTNGYVAEEILAGLSQAEGFSRERFFRGVTLPPSRPTNDAGRLAEEDAFPGDVVIRDGQWEKGKEIFDVIDDLKPGDVILKGANAVNLESGLAGILIGHPKAGTIGAAIQAVVGRRVRLILAVGLEKRVSCDLARWSVRLNTPGAHGPRMLPVAGEIITELQAVELLTGAKAELISAGGVHGAEGAIWLAIDGNEEQYQAAADLMKSIQNEPPFRL
ncbi:MAG: hypothetical protein JXA11_04460 [Phycisphaerae bacterium]|nr:hypothetical protein [Phycisphaerae bacterium]